MGYNEHLPGIAEIKERKRRERAEAFKAHKVKSEAIRALFRSAKPKTVGEMYALRNQVLTPGNYGRKAPHS